MMSQSFQSPDLENSPKGWRSLQLNEVADLKNGYAFKSKDYIAYSNTLNVRMSNIRPGAQFDLEYSLKYLPDEYADKHSGFLLDDGDLIIAMTDMANDPKILGVPTIIRGRRERKLLLNQRVGKLVPLPDNKIDIEYLRYYLSQEEVQKYLIARAKKGVQVNIGKKDILSVPVHHPPLPEQKKIAHILSTVQRAIEAQERIIQTTIELKKALMHKLFTEGLRNEPQKQTEIGPVPESWEVVPLETTGDVVYGIQAAVANNIAAVGTPILTNKNITLDGGIDLEKLNYFELRTKRHTATILCKGDILFNWRSGSKYHVGKTAYFDLDGEWVHSSFILRIRPNPKINGRYLFYYFNHLREAEFFVKLQTYAINAKFNKSAVSALPTAVPSREEQGEIVTILDSAQQKIDFAVQKHRALQNLFRTLLHELMTAKTRVHAITFSATSSNS